jgi:hypothetical protein
MCLARPCRRPCPFWRLLTALRAYVNKDALVEYVRHSREGGNPCWMIGLFWPLWIPAFAGMTGTGLL